MQIDIVVDGQNGSSGKGNVAGLLVDQFEYDTLIRVAGPNAGHTTYDHEGRAHALRTIPAACVRDRHAVCYIAPGSEVDVEVLMAEVDKLEAAGVNIKGRLLISPQATVLTAHHHEMERNNSRFGGSGSTFKGIGAARAERAMRLAPLVADVAGSLIPRTWVGDLTTAEWHDGRHMIEGTQGYHLGLHAGLYPHCTSSNTRAIDFLAMAYAPLTPDAVLDVYCVFRSYPIRIAGNSGPLTDELSWEELGRRTGGYIQPEKTTVTFKTRRVGEWDPSLVEPALAQNVLQSPPKVCLTFFDYLDPTAAMATTLTEEQVERALALFPAGTDLALVATSPHTGVWL